MSSPTIQQVIDKYLEDREKIRRIRAAAEAAISDIEVYQRRREDFLLGQEDPECFEFLTDLYLNGRDGKAAAESKKKDLGLQMQQIESWLLKMLDKLKSKGFKTEFGTVFPTRKESISVEDWDAFVEAEILRPAAQALISELDALGRDATMLNTDTILNLLRTSAHLEFLNKAVNKTACLERLGERDEKTDSRPNPPPAGVKYVALRTVGVRKS